MHATMKSLMMWNNFMYDITQPIPEGEFYPSEFLQILTFVMLSATDLD